MAKFTLTRKQFENIADVLGTHVDYLRDDYSGKAMYGKNCFGVVIDRECFEEITESRIVYELAVLQLTDEELSAEGYDLVDMLRAYIDKFIPRFDSMGLDRIVYFPNVQVEPDTAAAITRKA